jgi:uncharacterized Rmd1/YagE family protein
MCFACRETSIVSEDIIFNASLLSPADKFYQKLAFSHGIARSTKLGTLENHMDAFLHSLDIERIPKYMMRGQEPPLTAKQLLRKQGKLLQIRGMLNLHSGLLDSSPEVYWSRADLAKLFDSVSRTLDINPRIRVLNQRLDYATRLVDLNRDRMDQNHGTRMELIIIALIAVEVLFETIHYLNELGYIDLYGMLGRKSRNLSSSSAVVRTSELQPDAPVTD